MPNSSLSSTAEPISEPSASAKPFPQYHIISRAHLVQQCFLLEIPYQPDLSPASLFEYFIALGIPGLPGPPALLDAHRKIRSSDDHGFPAFPALLLPFMTLAAMGCSKSPILYSLVACGAYSVSLLLETFSPLVYLIGGILLEHAAQRLRQLDRAHDDLQKHIDMRISNLQQRIEVATLNKVSLMVLCWKVTGLDYKNCAHWKVCLYIWNYGVDITQESRALLPQFFRNPIRVRERKDWEKEYEILLRGVEWCEEVIRRMEERRSEIEVLDWSQKVCLCPTNYHVAATVQVCKKSVQSK
jgi:hypothetical protein